MRPNDTIERIRYFTAMVNGGTKPNQEVYLQALATTPVVEPVLGNFKAKRVKCGLSACNYTGDRFFQTLEEKRTDVNIAVYMLDDAYQDVCDQFVLVSGDSDLVPAIKMIRSRFPNKKVTVYVPASHPTRGFAVELRSVAHKHRDLPLNLLQHAQFPATVPNGSGATLTKPAAW